MEKGQVDLIGKFVERYMDKICNATNRDILEALCADGITDECRIRNYMIIHDFQIELVENGGWVYQAYAKIGAEYELSTSQVERIIRHWKSKFSKKTLAKAG